MFQDFTDYSVSHEIEPRIAKFRALLKELKLDGFYVPRNDEYMNEFIPKCAERLLWLTGFSGSAGQAVILQDKAALFVDGRYTVQAPQQVNTDIFEVLETPHSTASGWLIDHVSEGAHIGFDPKLHTIDSVNQLTKKLDAKNIKLVPVPYNPIDKIWEDRPASPLGPIKPHPAKYSGQKTAEKIQEQRELLAKYRSNAVILTLADSIAWLFNIRGTDVPHTPIPLCFAILHRKGKAQLFCAPEKISATMRKTLEKDVVIHDLCDLEDALKTLGKAKATVQLDDKAASYWFADILKVAGAKIVYFPDPTQGPKAIKNPVEIAGARQAHERDGIAVCRFLAWLDREAPSGALDEITVAKQLEQFRRDTGVLKEISFDTISGAGPNGAIVHYRVTEKSNRKLKKNTLYLVDSGAQYLDGTTDITRTIAIGMPTKEMQTRFTLVLKGHIAVAAVQFPEGTTGPSLDVLARISLWEAGLDYAHGTGHGVGSYLSVHETPPSLNKRVHHVLKPGMILSNEPGYYKPEKYGIRIENLLLVTEPTPIKNGEIDMMEFETLTLAPIDLRLVVPEMLSAKERQWLNDYHASVRRTIGPHMSKEDRAWLKQATVQI